MARPYTGDDQPLTEESIHNPDSPESYDRRVSISTASTTSLILEHINGNGPQKDYTPYRDFDAPEAGYDGVFEKMDVEDLRPAQKSIDPRYRRWLYILGIICVVGWSAALALFISSGAYKHRSTVEHNPDALVSQGSGKKITIDQLQTGFWYPRTHDVSWIAGPNGEDGMVLSLGSGKGYAVVEDVRSYEGDDASAMEAIVLMKGRGFSAGDEWITANKIWPSPDLKNVLVMSDYMHNWRHSYTGRYWIFNVESQTAEALDSTLR